MSASYEDKVKKNLFRGNHHICGHCANLFSCERMIIQNGVIEDDKRAEMKDLKEWITDYRVDALGTMGFVYVTKCSRFNFEHLERRKTNEDTRD